MEIAELANYLPAAVIVAIIINIAFTKATIGIAKDIEDKVEAKHNKQIKFFDHKKIWLSFFWCLILSIVLAVSGFITWRETVFYGFVIMGGSTLFYETIIKHLEKKDNNDSEG